MKEKIKETLIRLLEAPDLASEFTFTHENKKRDKAFTARVFYNENGEPSISLISFLGYNKNYVTSSIQQFFVELRSISALIAQSGDIILTRQYILNPPASGTVLNLSSEIYYYSVNGGLMSCNGDQLGRSFQAKFLKILNTKCNADSEIMAYSQFKLL